VPISDENIAMTSDSGTTGHRTDDATLDGLQGVTLLDDERVHYDLQPAWSNWADLLVLGTALLPVFGVGLILYAAV
jgi:hypothetical protein